MHDVSSHDLDQDSLEIMRLVSHIVIDGNLKRLKHAQSTAHSIEERGLRTRHASQQDFLSILQGQENKINKSDAMG